MSFSVDIALLLIYCAGPKPGHAAIMSTDLHRVHIPSCVQLLTPIINHSNVPLQGPQSSHLDKAKNTAMALLGFFLVKDVKGVSVYSMSLSTSFDSLFFFFFPEFKNMTDWKMFTSIPKGCQILLKLLMGYCKDFRIKRKKKSNTEKQDPSRARSIHRNCFTCVANISTSGP